MFDFLRLVDDSYVMYRNGERITPHPLTKQELLDNDKLIGLELSDDESKFIERFYGDKDDWR